MKIRINSRFDIAASATLVRRLSRNYTAANETIISLFRSPGDQAPPLRAIPSERSRAGARGRAAGNSEGAR